MTRRPSLSWELLARSAARMSAQRFERGATLVGLLGPLAICGWTMARPFDLRQSYHNLMQCAIWLCGWYVVFAMLYCVLVWLRPRGQREGEELAHLPLPATYFLMLRAMELGLIPLRCALLTLPLWLIVLAYIQIPYGQQWVATEWSWWSEELPLLWAARIGWTTVTLLTATLLPLGVALAISETVRNMALRISLLLLPATGIYVVTRFYAENFRMPYRTTIPFAFWYFALIPFGVFLLALLCGLLPGKLRVGAAAAIFIAVAASFLIPHVDYPPTVVIKQHAPRALRGVYNSSLWLAGHMSPPRNVRWLMERYDSAVLLAFEGAPPEPQYPKQKYDSAGNVTNQAAYDKQLATYQTQSDAYEKAYAAMPRWPMWVGAGLLPLLLPLCIFAGLMLGALRRGVERAAAA